MITPYKLPNVEIEISEAEAQAAVAHYVAERQRVDHRRRLGTLCYGEFFTRVEDGDPWKLLNGSTGGRCLCAPLCYYECGTLDLPLTTLVYPVSVAFTVTAKKDAR